MMRLIIDEPRGAALNMAIDEVLMESQRQKKNPPVLRIYFWSEPSCTVGYFQNAEQVARRFRCPERGIDVVRRITGGGMVLHGDDLTFSISLPNPNPFLTGDVKSSYLKINEALRVGLKGDCPDIDYADCRTVPSGRAKGDRVCFEAPSCYDLLRQGKKIVGASQRRKDGVILHQSAVFADLPREILVQRILEGFREKWEVNFTEAPLTEEELSCAREKEAARYGSSEWACPAVSLCSSLS